VHCICMHKICISMDDRFLKHRDSCRNGDIFPTVKCFMCYVCSFGNEKLAFLGTVFSDKFSICVGSNLQKSRRMAGEFPKNRLYDTWVDQSGGSTFPFAPPGFFQGGRGVSHPPTKTRNSIPTNLHLEALCELNRVPESGYIR